MSKGFRFSLQKVLNFKAKLEDDKAMHFKQSQARVQQQIQILDKITDTKQATLKATDENGAVSLNELRLSTAYVEQLNDRLESESQQLAEQEAAAEGARLELLEATKGKRVIEKLKERKLSEHSRNERQREALKENEVAIRMSQKEQAL